MEQESQDQRISQAAETALNLSHGVKNILQAIKGGREVIDHSFKVGDIERAQKGWAILKRNLDKIQKLVLDMLEYSRESKAVFGSCQFNRLIRSALETVQGQADEKGAMLTLKVDESIGVVRLDSDKIYDVALNLLLNAIDAVHQDSGIIEVITEADTVNKMVRLCIVDNGPGIEDIEAIWEPFHTSKSKVGTGLGLPIVRKSIEQHGGTIKVESKPGQGARFTVELPIKKSE